MFARLTSACPSRDQSVVTGLGPPPPDLETGSAAVDPGSGEEESSPRGMGGDGAGRCLNARSPDLDKYINVLQGEK